MAEEEEEEEGEGAEAEKRGTNWWSALLQAVRKRVCIMYNQTGLFYVVVDDGNA